LYAAEFDHVGAVLDDHRWVGYERRSNRWDGVARWKGSNEGGRGRGGAGVRRAFVTASLPLVIARHRKPVERREALLVQ